MIVRPVIQGVVRNVVRDVSYSNAGSSGELPSYTSPLPAGTTNLIVGNSLTDVGIIITYDAVRGALYQTGTIEISSPYTDLVNTPPVVNFDFDDIGLTFTADLSSNDIRLNCIVDAGVDVVFNYVVEVIKGMKVVGLVDGVPSGLALTVVDNNTLGVSFSSTSTNQDGYRAYISTDNSTFTEHTTNAGTSFNLTGLTSGILYYVKIVAYRFANESTASNTASEYTIIAGEQIGTLYSDAFARASLGADWSQVGADYSIALDGAKLTATGTAVGNYNYIKLAKHYAFEDFEITTTFKVLTRGANTWGVYTGIGSWERSLQNQSVHCYLPLVTTSASNKVRVCYYQNDFAIEVAKFTIFNENANGIAFSVNDVIRLRLVRVKNVFTAYAKNITTNGTEYSASFTYDLSAVTNLIPNSYFPFIGFNGSTVDVQSFMMTTTAVKRPNVIFIGDSITQGYRPTNFNERFAYLVGAGDYNKVQVFAGQNLRVTHNIDTLTDCISFISAKYAFLLIGRNDSGDNLAQATFMARLEAVVTLLKSRGIKVIASTFTPGGTADYRAAIMAMTSVDKTVDLYTAINADWVSTYRHADTIHPNTAGHDAIADFIIANCPEIL